MHTISRLSLEGVVSSQIKSKIAMFVPTQKNGQGTQFRTEDVMFYNTIHKEQSAL